MRALIAIMTSFFAGGCAAAQKPLPVFVDAGGCRIEQVTDAGDDDGHFQFHGPSYNDRLLVVGTYKGDAKGAYVLNLANGASRPLVDVTNAGAISADARTALVANDTAGGRTDIVEIDFRAEQKQTIATDPAADFLATYAPDGKTILFNSYRTGKSDIYVVDRKTGALRRLTDFDGYDAHADFSPDMSAVVFHREVAPGDYDVWRLDAQSLEATAVVSGPGEQAYPAWSPDGKSIAYAADDGANAGKLDLYLANPDGGNIRRVTRLAGYVAYPAWSRDGERLYFNHERGGKRNVFRLTIGETGDCLG